MSLTDEQAQFYRQTLEITKKSKDRLADLQAKKNAAKQIYDGACRMLGVENDLEKSEEPEA
jgi:hypothetical protein